MSQPMSLYDTANLAQLPHLKALAPSAMLAFENFDRAAMAPGAIPRKFKELMALAVAISTQCPYSLEIHRTNATNAGATEAEIAEAIFIAAACAPPPPLRMARISSARARANKASWCRVPA